MNLFKKIAKLHSDIDYLKKKKIRIEGEIKRKTKELDRYLSMDIKQAKKRRTL